MNELWKIAEVTEHSGMAVTELTRALDMFIEKVSSARKDEDQ